MRSMPLIQKQSKTTESLKPRKPSILFEMNQFTPTRHRPSSRFRPTFFSQMSSSLSILVSFFPFHIENPAFLAWGWRVHGGGANFPPQGQKTPPPVYKHHCSTLSSHILVWDDPFLTVILYCMSHPFWFEDVWGGISSNWVLKKNRPAGRYP